MITRQAVLEKGNFHARGMKESRRGKAEARRERVIVNLLLETLSQTSVVPGAATGEIMQPIIVRYPVTQVLRIGFGGVSKVAEAAVPQGEAKNGRKRKRPQVRSRSLKKKVEKRVMAMATWVTGKLKSFTGNASVERPALVGRLFTEGCRAFLNRDNPALWGKTWELVFFQEHRAFRRWIKLAPKVLMEKGSSGALNWFNRHPAVNGGASFLQFKDEFIGHVMGKSDVFQGSVDDDFMRLHDFVDQIIMTAKSDMEQVDFQVRLKRMRELSERMGDYFVPPERNESVDESDDSSAHSAGSDDPTFHVIREANAESSPSTESDDSDQWSDDDSNRSYTVSEFAEELERRYAENPYSQYL